MNLKNPIGIGRVIDYIVSCMMGIDIGSVILRTYCNLTLLTANWATGTRSPIQL